MSPPRGLSSGTSTFKSALDALDRLFARSLWRAKSGSSAAALSGIKDSVTAEQKRQVVAHKVDEWEKQSVDAIRQWVPRYVDLALIRPRLIGPVMKNWVRYRLERVLAESFGQDLDSVVWWFAVATEGKWLQRNSRKLSPTMRWKAPQWLLKNQATTFDLLMPIARSFVIRFYDVIDEELDKVLLDRAINSKVSDHDQNTDGRADEAAERRAAVMKKVSNPEEYHVVRTDEAAVYFSCDVRTINRWVKAGKLKAGEKIGTVTIESIKKLAKKQTRNSKPLLKP